MNYDISKAKIVPFAITEEDIRKNFLDWAILGDDTPIDIACNAIITKVQKKYYPIRSIEVIYATEWTAESYWEHKEEETYSEPRYWVVNEQNGERHITPNPNVYLPSYKHIETTYVQKKRYKTIVDKIERTSGLLEPQSKIFKRLIFDGKDEALCNWLDLACTDDAVPATDALTVGCEFCDLSGSDEKCVSDVVEEAKERATEQCAELVPGDRHEKLQLHQFSSKQQVTIKLIPFYEVTYTYNDKEYSVYFSGIKAHDALGTEKPVNADLEATRKQMTEEKESANGSIYLFLLLVIGFPIVAYIFCVMIGPSVGNFVYFLLLVAFAAEIFFIVKAVKAIKKFRTAKNELTARQTGIDEKKKKIAEIVKQDDLTAEQQKAMIQQVINS